MQEITENIVEEKFDKKKDFLEINSPICAIDEYKSLSFIAELMNRNEANSNKNLDYNLLMTFYNCIRKSNEHLISFYKMVNLHDLNTRKLFFIKNEIFENFIINNSKVDYLNYYVGAAGCISNHLTQKIILSENISIIKSYIANISSLLLKGINNNENLIEIINYFRSFILKNKDNFEIVNIIFQLSIMTNIRDNEYEEILMGSENYDSILKYAETFKLYRNEVVNACLKICDRNKGADYLNNYIKTIINFMVDFKNDKQIEDFLIKNYNYNSHNNTLLLYLTVLLKNTSNNPFVECVAAVAKAGNMANLEKILRFYNDCHKSITVPRLEEEVEKTYLQSCSGESFFNYIKNYNIVNDFINEQIANCFYNYPDQIYKYVFDNNLDIEALNKILINSTLTLKFAITKNIRLPDRENFIFNSHALNIGFTTTLDRANAIVKYIEIVYNSEKSVECLKQYEKDIMLFLNRNPEIFIKIVLKYISYTKKRFARYETFLLRMMSNKVFVLDKSINEYMAYCDNAKSKGVKKINDFLFSPNLNINHPNDKDLLLKYVLDYAKAPCELFDKSKIGNDPRYLQFKEDYEREKLARVKRQRRKPSGINPQEQGESGQGQQAPIGEDTNV